MAFYDDDCYSDDAGLCDHLVDALYAVAWLEYGIASDDDEYDDYESEPDAWEDDGTDPSLHYHVDTDDDGPAYDEIPEEEWYYPSASPHAVDPEIEGEERGEGSLFPNYEREFPSL